MTLTGDIMSGHLVDRVVVRRSGVPAAYVRGDTLPPLRKGDRRLINLECVIASTGTLCRRIRTVFHFRAGRRAIEALQAARTDGVNLADRHVLDFGEEAFREMLHRLDHRPIAKTWAGENRAEAQRPAILSVSGHRIAVVVITDNEPAWEACSDRPDVNDIAHDERGLRELHRSRLAAAVAAQQRARNR